MKRVTTLEEPLAPKTIKVFPTATAELCAYLEADNSNFSDFVRKMVESKLKSYKRKAKHG